MDKKIEKQIEAILINALSDGFNRAINALESSGALNTKKLKSKYSGSGSEYYDIVTQELELTVQQNMPSIIQVINKGGHLCHLLHH